VHAPLVRVGVEVPTNFPESVTVLPVAAALGPKLGAVCARAAGTTASRQVTSMSLPRITFPLSINPPLFIFPAGLVRDEYYPREQDVAGE
jgi:hypothetical protein